MPHFDRYMYASGEHVQKWGAIMGQMSGPKIGIVARGSNSFSNDKNRSCNLKTLIAQLPQHASYVVLQKELSADERFFIEKNQNVTAPGMALETFSDTAAICTLLDQVISVDTGVAHLAAALGKCTKILLAQRSDWRWGYQTEKSVWYPSVVLAKNLDAENLSVSKLIEN